MSHSSPDFAQEQRITERLSAIVKPAAFDEFITEHRDGYFDENSFDAWIAKRREDRPHRFIGDAVIDPELIARAAAGNMTARSQLFVKLGKDQPAVDQLLETERAKPKAEKQGGRNNPWSAEAWNLSAQGRLVREIGLVAAQSIAKSQGSYVGATRPNKAA